DLASGRLQQERPPVRRPFAHLVRVLFVEANEPVGSAAPADRASGRHRLPAPVLTVEGVEQIDRGAIPQARETLGRLVNRRLGQADPEYPAALAQRPAG